MTKIEVTEELRQAVIEAVAGALGGCAARVWMSQDEIADAAIAAVTGQVELVE
jgi:hypothetical protein